MGLCALVRLWVAKRPAIIMQNTAIGVTINTLATLTQYYRMPLPMLISYRGELGEPVACQVEMAVHTRRYSLNSTSRPITSTNKAMWRNLARSCNTHSCATSRSRS